MRTEQVTSPSNPKLKRLLALQEKSSLRRSEGLFVVEGRRETENLLEAGFVPETLFICRELFPLPEFLLEKAAGANPDLLVVELPKALYAKAAYRESTEGVIAEVRCRDLSLDDLHLSENPLIVVLEAVEKPGNLGAVLRSADAAGADAVVICDPLTDLYNPNLIRASLGAAFTVPCVACTSGEAIAWLKRRGIRILTAQLQDSSLYYDVPMTGGTAIVMGTESTGLTDEWRRAADAHIRIPMLGTLDSLNVSVSAAILLFEAVRQRQG
ncbi:MAG: RNA methyltransferase [Bacteroidales bacterium]|nr:RNA methyltransferase [Bacteroidales bacterium]